MTNPGNIPQSIRGVKQYIESADEFSPAVLIENANELTAPTIYDYVFSLFSDEAMPEVMRTDLNLRLNRLAERFDL